MAITDLEPRLLVEAHNAGDDAAFTQIVRAHHQSLFAHAVTRLHDVGAAEDAVQETFVRAYRAMPRFQGDFHLRAWLHRILTNVCHDEGARRQRAGRLFDVVSAQAVVEGEPADIGAERMDVSREVVATALASLPASYRDALVLRYVEELSYEEVAAATGVTEGNARIRVMRGRAALKRALTSSHTIVIAVVPWLRRGGRGTVTDLPGIASTSAASSVSASAASVAGGAPGALTNAPLLLRAFDTAPQLAERAASIPQILGMVAAMAVPIAAPVVGNEVAGWAAPPAATTAERPGGEVAAGAPRAGTATPSSTTAPRVPEIPAAAPADPSAGAEGAAATATTVPTTAGGEEGSASGSKAPPTSTKASTSTSTTPSTAPATTEAPGGATTPPPTAAPVGFDLLLVGEQLTSVGDPSTDLAGTITWQRGSTRVGGQLRGTLVFDRAAVEEEPPADEDPQATDASEPNVTPRTFTGALTLALDDGTTYRLQLTDGTLDDPDVGTAVAAAFELVDACDTVVATGSLTGDLDLQQAPVPSSLDLTFEGEGPAEVDDCG